MAWRRGMWVRHRNRTGILVAFRIPDATTGIELDVGEVHIVDVKGETVTVEVIPLADLRQARRMEIPAPRRPPAPFGRKLGYL